MANKKAIIVFAKYPEMAKVKTRLARSTGDEFAFQFYKLCCSYIFSEINKIVSEDLQCYLFYSGSKHLKKIKEWVGYDFEYELQFGNDLGVKMHNAFDYVFSKGIERCVIIGTDIPDINNSILQEAFEHLKENDYVISPSADGGYNYLGMKRLNQQLFENVKWSTNEVFPKTIKRIKKTTDKFIIADELIDIDTEEELQDWIDAYDGNTELKSKVKKLLLQNRNVG